MCERRAADRRQIDAHGAVVRRTERARDARGWTHVDRDGRPAYTARFAMVEPFYNGQARVERHDGALEVIDERGDTLVALREPGYARSPP